MRITLGKRLRRIADHVPTGSRLADIGSDHGYLCVWLLQEQRVSLAIAGEINLDPARRAAATCEQHGLSCRMSVRVGDGLQVLKPGEVDTIVIAGMGGTTMRSILDEGEQILAGVRRLILQPNVAGAELRRWLTAHRFVIVDEDLVEENGIIYELIVAEPGETAELTELQALLGPILLGRRPELFSERLKLLIAEQQYIRQQLTKASTPARTKLQAIDERIDELQAVLRRSASDV